MRMPESLDDLYLDVILDHYRRPRNQGLLPNPDLKSALKQTLEYFDANARKPR